jgi:hypothetical protein
MRCALQNKQQAAAVGKAPADHSFGAFGECSVQPASRPLGGELRQAHQARLRGDGVPHSRGRGGGGDVGDSARVVHDTLARVGQPHVAELV